MTILTVSRYHDISCGHRVVGHEGKCRGMHGHNYRVHFECVADAAVERVDAIGRVIDFSIIKSELCMWLEEHWDHKFLLWEKDPLAAILLEATYPEYISAEEYDEIVDSFVRVPFNPTAELMADHLLHVIAPGRLKDTGVICRKVTIEETRKCSAAAELNLQRPSSYGEAIA